MAVTIGQDGYFWAGAAGSAALVGLISKWSYNETANVIDTSAFGNTWNTSVTSGPGWTGSISGFCDLSDTGQTAVETSLSAGSALDVYFFLGASTYRYGSSHISGISVEDSHDGVVTFSADITGTGELYKKTA